MLAQARHRLILDSLDERSPLTIRQLEKRLNASPATVRRDLTFLEKLGKVIRTHGAVLHPGHVDPELSFDRKSRAALNAKIAIAEAATDLVKLGKSVFVDAGSTTFEIGKRLLQRKGLTIFTNSIPLLSGRPGEGSSLVAIGGEVRTVSMALTGAVALEWMSRIRIDTAFLGASGIDPAEGPTTTELAEAAVKQAVIHRAERVVVVADASKWGQPAAIRYADWALIHDFVTDHSPTRKERAALAQRATKLHIVSPRPLTRS